MEVQVYTKTDCPFCIQAKQWFKEFNIDIIEHCMDNEEDRLAKMYKSQEGRPLDIQ